MALASKSSTEGILHRLTFAVSKFESAPQNFSVILKRKVTARRALRRKNINIDKNKKLAARKLTKRQLRLLGILPLAFFIAQAIHYWQIDQLGHMLWMCNVGNLLLALGLFLDTAIMIRVAVIWIIPGLAVWFLFYILPIWGTFLTGTVSYAQLFGVLSSTLVHVGGFAVGIVVLRQVGMDARAWLYAFIWYFLVQLLSRLLTPAAMNVNLSHRIQDGWEQVFSAYWKFWLVLTLIVGVCLWLLGLLLKRIWPASAASLETRAP
jgi:hypothetical protein